MFSKLVPIPSGSMIPDRDIDKKPILECIGLGNMLGSIVAAAALTILPEALRQFSDYRMLVYAIVLILVMLATNNPTLRSYLDRAKAAVTGKRHEKEAA